LARIFQFVQGLVGLSTEDHRDPLKNAAHEVSAGPSRLRFHGRGPLAGFHRISGGKANTARDEGSFVFGVIP
jgi:hypothetical protein